MPELRREDTFTVWPQRLVVDDAAMVFRWSIYVVRVDLVRPAVGAQDRHGWLWHHRPTPEIA